MKVHATLILATVSVISLPFTGCEDSAARQRDHVQTKIRQASIKLTKVMVGSDEDPTPALQSVVADLSRIDGGEPGQQAAKALLTATALRELASIKLAQAEQIESAHRLRRDSLQAAANAALTLLETAAAFESVDAVAERQQLQREIESARAEVAELRVRIEQLDGPISERATLNATNKSEVDALRLKVNELRRRAQELGPADGLSSHLEAIETSRQADKIEYDIAQREIDLEHSLTPELTMTDTAAQQLDDLINSLEAARAQLDAFANATTEQINSIRKQIAEHVSLINASINEMESQRSGELASAYDEAQAALEKASSQARNAASQRTLAPEDLQAARLIGAQGQEMLGRLHWAKARGLRDHERLLAMAAALPGATGGLAERTAKLAEEHKQAIEQAKAAYEAAQEQASNVTSRDNPEQIERLTQNLEAAIKALDPNVALEPPAPAIQPPSPNRAAAASAPRGPQGADSPEALADALKSVRTASDIRRIFDFSIPVREITGLTPAMRAFHDNIKSLINGIAVLDEALQQKFGRSVSDLEPSQGEPLGQVLSVKDAQVQNVQGIRGTILVTLTNGRQKPVRITQLNNRWYLGSENDLIDNVGWLLGLDNMPLMSGGTSGDPNAQRMVQAMLEGIAQSFGVMGKALEDLAAAVNAGEFKSFEEFETESERRMEEIMKGALGPLGGPGMMPTPAPR